MAVKPKFYPILPYVKRAKRERYTISGRGNYNCTYLQRKWADWYTKSTKTSITYINSTATINMGACSQAGVYNPGWKQQVASGTDATTSYSRTVRSFRPIVYNCFSESKDYTSRGYGQTHGSIVVQPGEWVTLRDQATARLKHKLDGHIGNAKLAPPLAESREIHRMVKQINSLGIDTVKALLAIRKTRGKSALSQFGNIWLGFGFGVNPLLKDIQSAAESILDYTTRDDHRVRVVGTATREYLSGTKLPASENIAFGLALGTTNYAVHKQGVQIVAGVDLQIRSAASYSVLDHLGLKVSEIPSTLWELTPFSWAVDYFTTVSPWLDDMFYTLPGVTAYISQTEKYQSETTSIPYVVESEGFKSSGSYRPSVGKYVAFSRYKIAALPSRSLRVKSLDEIAQHGLTKFLNLASVLAQKRGPKL